MSTRSYVETLDALGWFKHRAVEIEVDEEDGDVVSAPRYLELLSALCDASDGTLRATDVRCAERTARGETKFDLSFNQDEKPYAVTRC